MRGGPSVVAEARDHRTPSEPAHRDQAEDEDENDHFSEFDWISQVCQSLNLLISSGNCRKKLRYHLIFGPS